MKKIILTGLVSVALSATLAEAKFFVGLQGQYNMTGVSNNTPHTPGAASTGNIAWGSAGFYAQNEHGWGVGINLGTEYDLSDMFGLRWFVGINYNRWVGRSALSSAFYVMNDVNIELGGDALIHFINADSFRFGMFVGLAARFTLPFFTNVLPGTSWSTHSFYPILGRVGFTFGLGERSRIDVGLNIPIATFNTRIGNVLYYAPLEFTLGYKILF